DTSHYYYKKTVEMIKRCDRLKVPPHYFTKPREGICQPGKTNQTIKRNTDSQEKKGAITPTATQQSQVQATKEDEDIIMKNRWLTDVQIGKAQRLLKQQFPNVQGLQATTLCPLQQFDVMKGNFVQILHTGAKHWICISNIYCNEMNAIKIYDSMHLGVNTFTKTQIASILYIESADSIKIMVEPVTQQMNGSDCGIFAIAFAAALCHGQDPSKMIFQIPTSRPHLPKHLKASLLNPYGGNGVEKFISNPSTLKTINFAFFLSSSEMAEDL
ncbi:Chromatin modification-related YNG2, partial [Paramuricea clavata]